MYMCECVCMHVIKCTGVYMGSILYYIYARMIVGLSTLSCRRKLHLAQTMFKCLSSQSPQYLSQLFSAPSSHYNTRSSSSSQLNLPCTKTSLGQKAFSFAGASLWRSLPANIRTHRDFKAFSNHCKDLFT